MKFKTPALLLASSCASVLPLSAVVVFSNDFEDGNLTPETGTWTFNGNGLESVVATASTDTTLGDDVALIDLNAGLDAAVRQNLGLELGLTSGISFVGPTDRLLIDFDFAARRTNGNAKTIFVDALDSNGDIVARVVLGDANAFGNVGGDRQRPGYDSTSAGNANTGNSLLPAPDTPGSFWWGADTSPATFDIFRDAHISISIGASGFDFATTSQAGVSYSTLGLDNYDSGTYADIASVEFSSVGTGYGFYLDNLVVQTIPEPSSAALLGLAGLGFLASRKR
ncbi:PEP-CTERM sorting domain-containing protein [Akkermansiaceae bacterium]|nr:PEP-CTERM sorting domain-containing protein [Akkermansiaceae bacterium]MDB4287677.1 PEP-CTERM sorting domain-containing protein [bacterium]MDB4258474.1 PEP-CTERM sorting domain-containing protein [Akkermansiaceae bacterium]MDB4267797.1 PEP-CTERM sorting domain-containing protein [Akkermansiaceae bacterium]MDB4282860.1 PEP-CTERM sorting domain-containing protein [Akkermansiaceae bacterium]